MSGARLAAELGRAIRDTGTGAVEWRDDKRRRLFFFRSGALLLVQSNLKSESPERVAERHPGLPPEALVPVVALVRLREALAEPRGEVVFHAGVPAPGFEALDGMELLWGAADRLPALPADALPRAVPAHAPLLARIPAGVETVHYLLELDGSRPVEDVLEFGPEEPDVVARALALACVLGAVEAVSVAPERAAPPAPAHPSVAAPTPPVAAPTPPVAGATKPTAPATAPAASAPAPSAPPRPPPVEKPVTTDDIAGFIQGALDEPTGEAPRPPARPPASGGAARPPSTPSAAAPPPPPRPPAWTNAAPPDPAPFGGASATIALGGALGGGRPEISAVAPEPEDALLARFGPALARIRGAVDHFGVLGTGWQDAAETHRRAYFALAQRLHPDRFVGEPPELIATAAELFERVRAAWEVIGDDTKREAYIARVIRGEKSEEELAMEKVRRILDAEADFKRGLTELNGGRLSVAHEHFVRAVGAAPDEVEFAAYAAYTTFRLAHGRDEAAANEAAKRLAAALQANEKLDGAWVLLGIVQRMTGQDAAARQSFVTALKLKPSNPDAVREMKRLEREKEAAAAQEANAGGLLSKLFKKK